MPQLEVIPGITNVLKVTTEPNVTCEDILFSRNVKEYEPESIVKEHAGDVTIGVFRPKSKQGDSLDSQQLIIDTGGQIDTYNLTVSYYNHIANVAIDGVSVIAMGSVPVKLGSHHTLTFDMDGTYRLYDLQWRDGTGGDVQHIADATTKAYNEYDDVWHCSVDVDIPDTVPAQSMLLYIQPMAATQVTGTLNMGGNLGSWSSDAPGGFFVGDTVTFTFTPNSGYMCESATSGGVGLDVVVDSTGKGTLTYTIAGNFTINVNFSQKVNATVTKNAIGCTIDTYPNQPIVGLPCSVIVTPSSDSKQCATLTHNGNNILNNVDSLGMGTGSFTPGSGSNVLAATVENKPSEEPLALNLAVENLNILYVDGEEYDGIATFPVGSEHQVTLVYGYDCFVWKLYDVTSQTNVEYRKNHYWHHEDGYWEVTFTAIVGHEYNVYFPLFTDPSAKGCLWRTSGAGDLYFSVMAYEPNPETRSNPSEPPQIFEVWINRDVDYNTHPDMLWVAKMEEGDSKAFYIISDESNVQFLEVGDVVHVRCMSFDTWVRGIITDVVWPDPYAYEEEFYKSVLTNMYIKEGPTIDFVVDANMILEDHGFSETPLIAWYETDDIGKPIPYEDIGSLKCDWGDIRDIEATEAYMDY